jgi:hypothetical protein
MVECRECCQIWWQVSDRRCGDGIAAKLPAVSTTRRHVEKQFSKHHTLGIWALRTIMVQDILYPSGIYPKRFPSNSQNHEFTRLSNNYWYDIDEDFKIPMPEAWFTFSAEDVKHMIKGAYPTFDAERTSFVHLSDN